MKEVEIPVEAVLEEQKENEKVRAVEEKKRGED